jgi:DNA-binding NtrC family response regulator
MRPIRRTIHPTIPGPADHEPARAVLRSTLHVGLVRLASQSDVRVLITATSEEVRSSIARAIHQGSRRAAHPFIPFDGARCLAADWDGTTGWARVCSEAAGGTLFVDNIGPAAAQALDAFFDRPGLTMPRLVVGTSTNLYACVECGAFPVSVYYRLNIIHIRIPD